MDLADGPFVWLAPSARRLQDGITDTLAPKWSELAVPYDVPLKDGRVFPTSVLNPFASSSPDERKRIQAKILGSMSSHRIDVAVKRGNAWAFFNHIKRKEKQDELLKSLRQKGSKP